MQRTLANRRENTRRSGQKTLIGNSEEKKGKWPISIWREEKHANGNKMSYHVQNHIENNFKFDNKIQFCLEKQEVFLYSWQIGFSTGTINPYWGQIYVKIENEIMSRCSNLILTLSQFKYLIYFKNNYTSEYIWKKLIRLTTREPAAWINHLYSHTSPYLCEVSLSSSYAFSFSFPFIFPSGQK